MMSDGESDGESSAAHDGNHESGGDSEQQNDGSDNESVDEGYDQEADANQVDTGNATTTSCYVPVKERIRSPCRRTRSEGRDEMDDRKFGRVEEEISTTD